MTMDDLSVFNSSSGFSCKHLDKSSNRSFKTSLLAFSLTDFFTFFAGLSFVTVVAAVVVSALVVAAATSEGARASNVVVVVVVVVWTEEDLILHYLTRIRDGFYWLWKYIR